jgi:hypothetical protein
MMKSCSNDCIPWGMVVRRLSLIRAIVLAQRLDRNVEALRDLFVVFWQRLESLFAGR